MQTSLVRPAVLFIVALDLALISIRVFLYGPFLSLPGGLTAVIEPAALLIAYALFAMWITSRTDQLRKKILRVGTPLGLLAGIVQITHMMLESLFDLGAANGTVTLASMSLTFLLWGAAGFRASRTATLTGLGVLTGSWSAVTTMLMTVTFGFALLYSSIPRLDDVAAWPEFQRSGWKDVHAFSIANSLEAGFSHLLIGPVVGAFVGGAAGLLARIRDKPDAPGRRYARPQ